MQHKIVGTKWADRYKWNLKGVVHLMGRFKKWVVALYRMRTLPELSLR
jgi:hypothetical protein